MKFDHIEKVTVVGSGAMGSGIAQNLITAGFSVSLQDISDKQLEAATKNIGALLERKVIKGTMAQEEKDACLSRLSTTQDVAGVADADLVIEAASENIDVKNKIFTQIVQHCKAGTYLATNTSSISVTEIAAVTTEPDKFVGMHFFNPVPVMKLLEIVRGQETSEETIEMAKEIGEKMGKVCIVSKDRAGFIVNRMLDPMLNEACELLDAGVGTAEDIDKGCIYGLNHPMGPLALADMAGLDILLAVMEVIYADTGDSKYRPSPLLRRMVAAGRLGRKAGKGFYDYT